MQISEAELVTFAACSAYYIIQDHPFYLNLRLIPVAETLTAQITTQSVVSTVESN